MRYPAISMIVIELFAELSGRALDGSPIQGGTRRVTIGLEEDREKTLLVGRVKEEIKKKFTLRQEIRNHYH